MSNLDDIYEKAKEMQDLLIEQNGRIDRTLDLLDEWLIKLESNITIGDLHDQ